MKRIIQYGLYPLIVPGLGSLGIYAIWLDLPWLHLWLAALLLLAILLVTVAERIAPYNPDWNKARNDVKRDIQHAVVNELSIVAGVAALPIVGSVLPWPSIWPAHWPLVFQMLAAVLVMDAGITFTHYWSHRYTPLWRLHANHHSVKRMYGFNGLMKHPLHQSLEISVGILPLLLLGLPPTIALALGLLSALQLLLQHTNADIRLGPFRTIIAAAEGHRFHHQKWPGLGDVNFGLFTLLWDHLMGTYHYEKRAPFSSSELGIAALPNYPESYMGHLLEPFRPYRPVHASYAAEGQSAPQKR